jgi:hypothetical protein
MKNAMFIQTEATPKCRKRVHFLFDLAFERLARLRGLKEGLTEEERYAVIAYPSARTVGSTANAPLASLIAQEAGQRCP